MYNNLSESELAAQLLELKATKKEIDRILSGIRAGTIGQRELEAVVRSKRTGTVDPIDCNPGFRKLSVNSRVGNCIEYPRFRELLTTNSFVSTEVHGIADGGYASGPPCPLRIMPKIEPKASGPAPTYSNRYEGEGMRSRNDAINLSPNGRGFVTRDVPFCDASADTAFRSSAKFGTEGGRAVAHFDRQTLSNTPQKAVPYSNLRWSFPPGPVQRARERPHTTPTPLGTSGERTLAVMSDGIRRRVGYHAVGDTMPGLMSDVGKITIFGSLKTYGRSPPRDRVLPSAPAELGSPSSMPGPMSPKLLRMKYSPSKANVPDPKMSQSGYTQVASR